MFSGQLQSQNGSYEHVQKFQTKIIEKSVFLANCLPPPHTPSTPARKRNKMHRNAPLPFPPPPPGALR